MSHTHDLVFNIELGGGASVREAEVSIYRATKSKPKLIEEVKVKGSEFSVRLPRFKRGYYYAVAEIRRIRLDGDEADLGDRRVQLISVFPRDAESVALSERVTVATAYSFARFLEVGGKGKVAVAGTKRSLRVAYLMKNNFVGTDGALSLVLQDPPNGMQTNSYGLFNFLSNLVFYSLTDPEVYAGFTELTQSNSVLGALLHLVRHPFTDPQGIYGLISRSEQVYAPSLPSLEAPATPVPDQWTLTIKVNDSGAENFMIAGVGYLDFDKNDRIWISINTRQGTPNSSTFTVILEPDGSPAPFSPLFGGGALGAGFGVAADPKGKTICIGSYGWGPTEWNPHPGAIALFSHKGEVLSPSNGFTKGLSRVQGVKYDADGNLWICSWGTQDPMPPTSSKYNYPGENSAAVVYLGGDPECPLRYSFDSPHHMTFDVDFDDEGYAYVSNSGFKGDAARGIAAVVSSVYKFRIEGGELCPVAKWVSDTVETFRQVSVSPQGDVFVAAVSTGRVIRFDRELNYRGEYKKNIHGPWGVGFDPAGTMYVSNFAREMDFESPDPIGPYGVTVVRDLDESTARLMTLPTGGDQVTLINGLPLYGNPQDGSGQTVPDACFDPLMRLTATRVDRAGNLWACNNWKPSALNDVIYGNPGGDGLVAFVGIAEPLGED